MLALRWYATRASRPCFKLRCRFLFFSTCSDGIRFFYYAETAYYVYGIIDLVARRVLFPLQRRRSPAPGNKHVLPAWE